MTFRVVGRTHLAWQIVFGAAVGVVVILALKVLLSALMPVVLALVLAFAMSPLVRFFERLRLPHVVAIVAAFLLTIGALAGLLLWLIPSVVHELDRFRGRLPGSLAELRNRIDPLLARFGARLPASVGEITDRIGSSLQTVTDYAVTAVGGLVSGALAIASSLVNILLVPLFTFYLLKDGDQIRSYLVSLIPPRHRPYMSALASDINLTLGGFIRGQLTVMLVLSVCYATGLSIVGIDLAVVIGVLTGLLCFIPYIGLGVGLALALLMAALSGKGLTGVVGVLAVFGVVGMLDAMFITPKIVGGKVGLSAPAVIIALLVFSTLFGFTGVLVAVPGSAVLKIVIGRLVRAYQNSIFYTRGDPAADPVALALAEPAAADEPRGTVVIAEVPAQGAAAGAGPDPDRAA